MPDRTSEPRGPDGHAQAPRDGRTQPAQGPAQQRAPRMPHERDESADSQAPVEPSTQRMGQIAHDDVERGLVDTDKGPPLDETYEKYRKGGPGGKNPLNP